MATAANTAIVTRETSDVGLFQRQLESRARDIQSALPGHITPDKFQRTILTAVAQNPDLLKADRGSLILSCYRAAQDALLPDGREAALVTFNTRFKDPEDQQWKSKKLVQYMPMVYGLRKKILQSAEVVSLEVNVVYQAEVAKGTFLYEVGLEPPLRHRPSLDLTEAETTDDQIVAAYSIATMKDGTKSYEIMRRFEIDKVRQTSQTGATGKTDRQGRPIEPKGPWVDWFGEMAKKTVMRRHAKTLPMSGDVLIDVEGRDLERTSSAALALGSTAPDEALVIEDHSEETPHDPETGEIIEEASNEQSEASNKGGEAPNGVQPEPEKTKAAPKGKAKAEPEKAEEANPPAPQQEEASDRDEQTGVTKDPSEAIADRLLGEFANARNEAELDKLWNSSGLERSSMPPEIHEVVTNGFNKNLKRLRQAEPAAAK